MQKIAAAINRFIFGEVSPLIISRDDLDKYPAGCQTLENFIPLIQGPIRRRGGTRLVSGEDGDIPPVQNRPLRASTRRVGTPAPVALVDFVFSETTSYLLAIGDKTLSVYFRDERILPDGVSTTIPAPWLQADLFDENGVMMLKWVQSGDVLYVVAPGQPPQKISRFGHNDWRIEPLPGWGNRPNGQAITIFRERLCIAAGRKIYFSQAGAFENFGAEAAGQDTVSFSQPDSIVQAKEYWGKFEVTAADRTIVYTNYIGDSVIVGTKVTITFTEGDAVFNVVNQRQINVTLAPGKTAFGPITFSSIGVPTDAGLDVDEASGVITMGLEEYPGGAGFESTPGTATFGGAISGTASFGSSAGAMTKTFVVDGISSINSGDPLDVELMHPALWLVPVDTLAVGTAGDEYHIGETVLSEPFGPDNVKVTPETSYGSAPIQALRAGSSLLFVQRSSRKVREFIYNYASESYSAIDVTLAAEHITKPALGAAGGLVGMVWQAEPIETLWCVRSDGLLVGLTFNNDQSMLAWHRHILGGGSDINAAPSQEYGKIKSIAVLPGVFGIQDTVYMCVERTIEGQIVYYVEKLERGYHEGEDPANLFYVDCGITASIENELIDGFVVSGLEHLEGQVVSILADGAVQPNQVVEGGKITLRYKASVVQVGLPFESQVRTLPLSFVLQDGVTTTRTKRFIGTTLRMIESVGGKIGNDDTVIGMEFRTGQQKMNEPIPLFTGDHYISWPGGFGVESFVKVTQSDPLPLIIAGIYPIIHVGNA